MIDTHCHLTFAGLSNQVEAVLDRARAAGVDRMITVCTSLDDARAVATVANQHDEVYATVGVHPHYTGGYLVKNAVVDLIQELVSDAKIVALGEIGLDRHYDDPPIEDQRRVFGWQLEMASQLNHPIIIHNREATDEVLAMIRGSGISGQRFVFHCFTGTRQELEAILEFGAMVSFTGIVTFKKATDLAACTSLVPLDRIMIETDSPYLTPEPYRKVRPNEPCYVPWVAKFLAAQRGMDEQAFISVVDQNAQRFFGIPPSD